MPHRSSTSLSPKAVSKTRMRTCRTTLLRSSKYSWQSEPSLLSKEEKIEQQQQQEKRRQHRKSQSVSKDPSKVRIDDAHNKGTSVDTTTAEFPRSTMLPRSSSTSSLRRRRSTTKERRSKSKSEDPEFFTTMHMKRSVSQKQQLRRSTSGDHHSSFKTSEVPAMKRSISSREHQQKSSKYSSKSEPNLITPKKETMRKRKKKTKKQQQQAQSLKESPLKQILTAMMDPRKTKGAEIPKSTSLEDLAMESPQRRLLLSIGNNKHPKKEKGADVPLPISLRNKAYSKSPRRTSSGDRRASTKKMCPTSGDITTPESKKRSISRERLLKNRRYSSRTSELHMTNDETSSANNRQQTQKELKACWKANDDRSWPSDDDIDLNDDDDIDSNDDDDEDDDINDDINDAVLPPLPVVRRASSSRLIARIRHSTTTTNNNNNTKVHLVSPSSQPTSAHDETVRRSNSREQIVRSTNRYPWQSESNLGQDESQQEKPSVLLSPLRRARKTKESTSNRGDEAMVPSPLLRRSSTSSLVRRRRSSSRDRRSSKENLEAEHWVNEHRIEHNSTPSPYYHRKSIASFNNKLSHDTTADNKRPNALVRRSSTSALLMAQQKRHRFSKPIKTPRTIIISVSSPSSPMLEMQGSLEQLKQNVIPPFRGNEYYKGMKDLPKEKDKKGQ